MDIKRIIASVTPSSTEGPVTTAPNRHSRFNGRTDMDGSLNLCVYWNGPRTVNPKSSRLEAPERHPNQYLLWLMSLAMAPPAVARTASSSS